MPDGLRASSVLEVAWDLIPDMTGTNLLPELVGRDEVKELTFTGRIVCGDEAVRIRLVTGTDPGLLAAAIALAKEIAGRSPHAVRAAKGPSSSSPTSATSNSRSPEPASTGSFSRR